MIHQQELSGKEQADNGIITHSKLTDKNDAPDAITSEEAEKENALRIYQLFRFATMTDLLMIVVAFIGSAGIGVIHPASIIIFGDFLGSLSGSLDNDPSILLDATLDIILIFVYMGVAVFISGYISHCFWVISGERQARRIRTLYVHSVLRQDMTWFDLANDGSLTTRLATDTQMIQDGISEKLGLLVQMTASVITGVIVAFVKGWQLAVVMLAPIPVLAGVSMVMSHLYTKNTMRTQNVYAEAGAIVEQVFSAIRTVYAFSLESHFAALYETKLVKACATGTRRGILLGLQFGAFICLLFFSYGLAFWYGAKLTYEGSLDGPRVLIAFYAMLIGTMSLLTLPLNLAAVSAACGAACRIFAVIDRIPPIDPDATTGLQKEYLEGNVEFRHVHFSYPTRPNVPVLVDFSIKVDAGKTIALVGASGSGKSTAVQLLQRFYDTVKGDIVLDGRPLHQYNLQWLRRQMGVVSQEPVLFNMTLRENLLLGSDGHVTESAMVEACKSANCHDFIMQLPNRYDTLVGDHGGMLSGGQKQRIAIARAIIHDPKILLLDEATSALDTASERLVQHALDAISSNRTTIVIAHRLSTIRNADLIVVLNHGRVIEQGTHTGLIQKEGAYAELVRKQRVALEEDFTSEDRLQQQASLASLSMMSNDDDKVSLEVPHLTEINPHGINSNSLMQSTGGPDSKPQKKKGEAGSTWKLLFKVLLQAKPEWHLIIAGTLGAMITGAVYPVCSLVLARVITIIIDPHAIINPGPMQGANLYAFLLAAIGIAALVGFVLQMGCFEVAGERYTKRLRGQMLRAFMKQEVAFYDEESNNVGALTSALAVDAKNVNELVSKTCGEVASLLFTAVTGFTIAFVYSWALSLIVLATVPFTVAATAYESRVEMGYADDVKKASIRTGEVAGEAFKAARTVASMAKQRYFEGRFCRAAERPHQLAVRKAYLASIGHTLGQSMSLFTHAVAFYGGVRLMSIGMIDMQDMMVVLLSVLITSQNIGRVANYMSGIAKAKHAAISAFEILERKPGIDGDLEGCERDTVQGDVSFRKVAFQYPARNVPIYKGDFNLDGFAGQNIALVGGSGCGKSTVIAMLERWYDPTAGEIRLDGRTTASYTLSNLRGHMALVGQEPVLFDMSIRENIQLGIIGTVRNDNVTMQEIEQACMEANIHDFISSLPQGYDMRVGDRGSQLSGGQKQRIAIARALIRQPRLLLLDEATSALDSESEKLVQAAIDNVLLKGKRTTITIAHRLSTIQGADLICVIHDGRVVERGLHQDLLRLNGLYKGLVEQQSLTSISTNAL